MAHFAKIGINSKVIAVHVVNDSDCKNADGLEDESVGQAFLERIHGWPGPMWVQTSYNTRRGKHYNDRVESGDQSKALRGNYAGIGMIWDEDKQLFYYKQPHASWTLNDSTGQWEAPTPMPSTKTNGKADLYTWNESTKAWDEFPISA